MAGDPELAKFTSKSSDSGHFWADPGKMCFLVPKTGFWPATQNLQNLRQNLTILGTFGPILGKCVFCYQRLDFGQWPRIDKITSESSDSGLLWADPGKMRFCNQKPGFGRRPKISKFYVTFERFWTLLNRSWANVLSTTTTTTTTNTVLLELLLATCYCYCYWVLF